MTDNYDNFTSDHKKIKFLTDNFLSTPDIFLTGIFIGFFRGIVVVEGMLEPQRVR